MSAIISWTSWKLAIGTPNCRALLRVGDRGLRRSPRRCRRSRPRPSSGPESSADIAILKPSPTSPISASSATSTPSSEIAAVSEARSPSLPWISWVAKPSLVGRDEEAGDAPVPRAGSVWAKTSATSATLPSEIHIFWPVIRQPPSIFSRPGAQRGGVGAGVGLGQPEAAERLAGAQPRQPALLLLVGSPALDRAADQRGLDRDDGAHRRVAAPDLLDDQPVGDVVEARARRTPRRPARPGSPSRRAAGRARGRSAAARSLSRARGTTSLSTKSRAVSAISRCSSVSSRGPRCAEPGRRAASAAERAVDGARERLLGVSASAGRGVVELAVVDRARPAAPRARSRRGTPRAAPSRSSTRYSPSSTSQRSRRSAARVIESRMPALERRASAARPRRAQKMVDVGASSTIPSGRTRSASSAPRPAAIRVACMLARVGERLDAGEDHASGQ